MILDHYRSVCGSKRFMSVAPIAIVDQLVEIGMMLDEKIPDLPDLEGLTLIQGE